MEYKKITIATNDTQLQEILIAILSQEKYDSFEQFENELIAYIPTLYWDNIWLEQIISPYSLKTTVETIPKQNWNANWEANYEPIAVADFCTIRADFHEKNLSTKYDILIHPKMSFGTGHHATTQIMITLMQDISFEHLIVLDFGTGTGVLAILAEKLNAKHIDAIDIEDWSVENTIENALKNNCSKIKAIVGDLGVLPKSKYDIILANINRHILIQNMSALKTLLNSKGQLIISGILKDDLQLMENQIKKNGLVIKKIIDLNGWMGIAIEIG